MMKTTKKLIIVILVVAFLVESTGLDCLASVIQANRETLRPMSTVVTSGKGGDNTAYVSKAASAGAPVKKLNRDKKAPSPLRRYLTKTYRLLRIWGSIAFTLILLSFPLRALTTKHDYEHPYKSGGYEAAPWVYKYKDYEAAKKDPLFLKGKFDMLTGAVGEGLFSIEDKSDAPTDTIKDKGLLKPEWITPEDMIDILPDQQRLFRSGKPLEFTRGILGHGRDGLDLALITGEIEGECFLTRVFHVWGIKPFNKLAHSPAIFLIEAEYFDRLCNKGKAVLEGDYYHYEEGGHDFYIFDPYPKILDGFPLKDVFGIWTDQDTWERYEKILKQPDEELDVAMRYLKHNLKLLLNAGRIHVFKDLRHTEVKEFMFDPEVCRIVGKFYFDQKLDKYMPKFRINRAWQRRWITYNYILPLGGIICIIWLLRKTKPKPALHSRQLRRAHQRELAKAAARQQQRKKRGPLPGAREDSSKDKESKPKFNRREFLKSSALYGAAGVLSIFGLIKLANYLIRAKRRQVLEEVVKKTIEQYRKRAPDLPFGFFDMESADLPAQFTTAAEKVYKATARVLVYRKSPPFDKIVDHGSGVVVSPDGHIMTAYHGLKSPISDDNCYIVVEIPTVDSSVRIFKRYPNVKIVRDMCDKELDIGVVKIETNSPLDFVKPEPIEPEIGNKIFMFGHPRGAERCYLSPGEIIEPSPKDEAFQFRHNADSRGGSSGSGLFLIDSNEDVHFAGIGTMSGGLARVISKLLDPLDVADKIADIALTAQVPDELSNKYPTRDIYDLAFHDIVDELNPNLGPPVSFSLATRLSAYLTKDKASELVSYPYPSKPATFPEITFVLTRSKLMTYGKDKDVERISKLLIAKSQYLAPLIGVFGIRQIHIAGHSKISEDTLWLSYDTKDLIMTIQSLLAAEESIFALAAACQNYDFNIDIDKDRARNDMLEDVLLKLIVNLEVIADALKGTGIKDILISNMFAAAPSTLLVHWDDPDILQTIMEGIELERLLIRANKNLAHYGFDVSFIYGAYDIEKTKNLLNKIEQDAKAISKLLKKKRMAHIAITFYNWFENDIVCIDIESDNPLDSIKEAYQRGPMKKSELQQLEDDLREKRRDRREKGARPNMLDDTKPSLYNARPGVIPKGRYKTSLAIIAAA